MSLRESEELWATTLASIGDAVMATDVDGNVTFINSVAEALTGWTQAEAAGKPAPEVFNVINEHTREKVANPVANVLQDKKTQGLANHTVLIRKDGTEVPIDDSAAPIHDREGRTSGVILVFRDVTIRRRTEETLRFQGDIIEAMNDAVIVTDTSMRITGWNKGAERTYGWTEAEVLGKPAKDVVRSDMSEEERSELYERLARGESVHTELYQSSKEDSRVFVMGYTIPMTDLAGNIKSYVVVNRDISIRKRAEEDLRAAKYGVARDADAVDRHPGERPAVVGTHISARRG